MPASILQVFRSIARETPEIDTDVYERFGKDPLDPIVGLGNPDAPLAFMGRDPGRDEVRYGEPFIGGGGQIVRRALYFHLHGTPMPDFEASRFVGKPFFWMNTVPYKPIGNKAWSMKVKRRFHPLMRELLLTRWRGGDIITLGREAFLWFGIDQPKQTRETLEAFWRNDARFTESIEVMLALPSGPSRAFRLHPLPHPSPLNQTWFKRFPDLLASRLSQLKVRQRGSQG